MPDGGDDDDGSASAVGDSGPPRILVDAMCGKLATYLRMCGYDAAYSLDRGIEADDRMLSLAAAEDRILVTRDRELASRADDALLLTERDVLDQLREVDAAGFPVELADEPTRCGACNGPVERVGGGDEGGNGAGSDRAVAVDRPEYVPDDVGPSAADDAEAPDSSAATEASDSRPAWRCLDCGRWFWKGSHWDSVAARLDEI